MSWLQRLVETYDACFGRPQFESNPLTPIDHVEQQAHIEIVLDKDGNFLRASIVAKEKTLIPATEKSAGRTSGAAAHPLCDKLRYVASDYGSEDDYKLYHDQLKRWADQVQNPRLQAILQYIERGHVVQDLLTANILVRGKEGLERKWREGLSELAKLLSPDSKTKERDQGDAMIRWRVELPEEIESAVWKDEGLQREWAAYNAQLPVKRGLCFVSGTAEPLAFNHPKGIRRGGDGAKLISSNDSPYDEKGKKRQHGYTFVGRFTTTAEAYGLGSATTQKAHNALRWLIGRQSARNGDQVIVAWSVQTAYEPPVLVDSEQFFKGIEEKEQSAPEPASSLEAHAYKGDAGQAYALRLTNAVRGYKVRIRDSDSIVVMALDSATKGRMAILYYRELTGSEFLSRIERWYSKLAWPQDFGKNRRFVGAPAPQDIAEAAYGSRLKGESGDKLRKATIERLLPCIVDARPLPRDLVEATVARASNRAGLEAWEFEKCLGIACSLYRGSHLKEFPTMSLDEARTTRDYLYGRLLAVADNIESMALGVANEGRETNAARLTQRFADHPCTTWRTLELQLRPYIARLNASRYAGALELRKQLMDKLMTSFPVVDGENSFLDNRRLSGEFLLGFHSQREALRPPKKRVDPVTETSDEIQGDDDEQSFR